MPFPDPTTDDAASLMWDAVVAILTSETNIGPSGPGSGNNPNGRLASVNYVHESIDLWYPKLPVCGVQLDHVDYKEDYGQHATWVKAHFKIVVAADSGPPDASGKMTLDAAMRKVRTLIADGKGNGICPIFRDKANFQLPATPGETDYTAAESGFTGYALTWEFPEQTNLSPRAVGTIGFWASTKAMRNV